MSTIADIKLNVLPAQVPRTRYAAILGEIALPILFSLSVVAPVITISPSLPWFKFEQLALVPIGLLYFWFLMAGLARPFHLNGLVIIAAVYCGCILLSLFYGTAILGHEFLFRDLYEIPKALLPVAFFMIGQESRLSEISIRRILSFFSVALVLVCFYGWAQWMDLNVSHWLTQFYSGGAHDEGSLAHYRRVYSTMGNPNVLGQLLTWAIAAFTLALLLGVGNRLRNFVLVVICLVTLAMTGSRYGLIDTALAFLIILVLSLWTAPRRRSTLVLVALLPVFVCVTIAVATSNRATLDRFQSLRNPSQTDSLEGRLDSLWPDAEHEFFQSPLLGHGPAKVIFSDIFTDSEYLDVLKEFGLLGFAAYFAYFVYALQSLWSGLKRFGQLRTLSEGHSAFSLGLQLSFVILITGLMMNVGMSTFYSSPLQGFFWLWLGVGANCSRTVAAIPDLQLNAASVPYYLVRV